VRKKLFLASILSVVAATGHAGEWVNLGTVSNTVAGHICDVVISPGGYPDIDCPEGNPEITASGVISATGISVTGAISTTSLFISGAHINVAASPTDGQALVYNGSTGVWEPGNAEASSITGITISNPGECDQSESPFYVASEGEFHCPGPNDAFAFTDEFDVALSTSATSNIEEMTGINTSVSVTISGQGSPQFRICSDSNCSNVLTSWTSSGQSIQNNEYVQLSLTGAATNLTTHQAQLDVGTGTAQWSVMTIGTCSVGGESIGGACWYLSAEGASCDTACSGRGGYNSATRTYAGSDGSNANCEAVMNALLGVNGVAVTDGDFGVGGLGCGENSNSRFREILTPTTSDASFGIVKRACACNN